MDDLTKQNLLGRFNRKYVKGNDEECWIWMASTAGKGYGQIKLPRSRHQEYAHRVAWLLFKGEIPEKTEVCHTCDNTLCVNPNHLFLGTRKDNAQDMRRKGRSLYGEKNSRHVLHEDEVFKIKKLLSDGLLSQSEIARVFNVHQITISKIKRGLLWRHVHG